MFVKKNLIIAKKDSKHNILANLFEFLFINLNFFKKIHLLLIVYLDSRLS